MKPLKFNLDIGNEIAKRLPHLKFRVSPF
jgi:hypothetical protein